MFAGTFLEHILHKITSNRNKLLHGVDDLVGIENMNGEWIFSEIHDVAKVNGTIRSLCHFQ